MKAANPRRTAAWNNPAHAGLDERLKRKLLDREIRAGYAAENKRIELVTRALGADPQIDLVPGTACA
ncbi:MAG: hypothetical protein ABSH34_15680 [Verrucomicrobiota bacterium]|jgi:hypothetical protein